MRSGNLVGNTAVADDAQDFAGVVVGPARLGRIRRRALFNARAAVAPERRAALRTESSSERKPENASASS